MRAMEQYCVCVCVCGCVRACVRACVRGVVVDTVSRQVEELAHDELHVPEVISVGMARHLNKGTMKTQSAKR
jgi:hypothetical protein